jgi:2-keto-4-pentenoate hydratase/2-oxohepta-3-ene-1,7-dioic acid hydratase in catechol pathway
MLAAWQASRPLFDERLEAGSLSTIEIAPTEEALTFGRRWTGAGHDVLLITDYGNGRVLAVNLSAHFGTSPRDAVELFQARGYEAIAAAASRSVHTVILPSSDLTIPIETSSHHIAAGANFAGHADEAGIGQPFIFPKRVAPTPSTSPVPMRSSRRLDYEVELAFVTVRDVRSADDVPATMGLLLCNDFTDRWTLVRGMMSGGEMGTSGFADAKGQQGFLPVGPLFVVPRNLERFYPRIELSLYVNGRLRQRARAGNMIWGPAEIIDQTFQRTDWSFGLAGRETALLPNGMIPARTLILSGTPEGVIFRPVNVWWAPPYLDPGDEVIARATHLGTLRNTITR